MRKFALSMAILMSVVTLGAATLRCHSTEFYLAKNKLRRLVLTPAQQSEIARYEVSFKTQWNRTHRAKGCSHHEDHAKEFVALAAGVLTPGQFSKFKGRTRNVVEATGYSIRQTGTHIENLIKLAKNL